MKKLLAIAVFVALLFSVGDVFASVGYKKNGTDSGQITDINIQSGYSERSGSVVTLYTSGYKAGVTAHVSGESNLTSAALAYGVINRTALDNTVAYRCSLADGTPGQMITLILTAVTSGTWVITDDGTAAGSITKTGWDDITLDAALDSVTLLYVDDTTGWVIIGGNSVTIT